MDMPAAQFRVRFFDLLDEIAATGEEIVITKHGRPVVRVVPEPAHVHRRWGCMKESIQITGDIEAPVLPSIDEWCADDVP